MAANAPPKNSQSCVSHRSGAVKYNFVSVQTSAGREDSARQGADTLSVARQALNSGKLDGVWRFSSGFPSNRRRTYCFAV